jgi:hypothetical protein
LKDVGVGSPHSPSAIAIKTASPTGDVDADVGADADAAIDQEMWMAAGAVLQGPHARVEMPHKIGVVKQPAPAAGDA